MGAFFVYSLKSSLCLAAFYLFYKLLLSRDTFHRFNRMALFCTMILSVIIPVITITSFPVESLEIIPEISSEPYEMLDPAPPMMVESASPNRILSVLLLTYLAGCGLFLIRNLWDLCQLLRIIRKGEHTQLDNNIRLTVHSDHRIAPFSWMKNIVVSLTDMNEAGDTILLHEQAHIRHYHSLDLLLAELCILFQWYNPAVWLLYRELQHIHEYEADQSVINHGINAKQYQLLLIKKAVGTRLYSMANSMNHSNLKKRITMMLQKKSNAWARLKYAYVLPLAAITMMAFARPEISETLNGISNAKVSHLIWKVNPPEAEKFSPEVLAVIDPAPSVMPTGEQSLLSENIQTDGMPVQTNAPAESTAVSLIPSSSTVRQVPDTTIFVIVEESPEFPGGDPARLAFIEQNVRYPKQAQEEGIQGRVALQFVVEKDGSITNVEILRGVDPELDVEALRVVRAMPKWIPGKQKGQPVRVRFTLPITFRLHTESSGNNTARQPANSASVEDIQVSGFVTNAKDGKQIAGVAVRIKDGNTGSVSDMNGKYTLKVPSNAILLFSFVGMATKEIAVNNQQVINVVLDADGQPATGTEWFTQLQNTSTIGANPLIIIDGKEGGDLQSIAPANIATISILKDHYAIEQYGEKGKNGVVIVTTKK